MASITTERGSVNAKAVFAAALAETQDELVKRLGAAVGQGLEANIEVMLGRSAYVRRERIGPWVEVSAVCHRCKCRQSQRFLRNGHRAHTVLTLWGEVTVWVQRLVCVCGGSVQLEMDGWLRPYQRIGDDVDAQIRRWGALRVSLREMQAELEQLHLSPLALRTLNVRLQQVAVPPAPTTPAPTTPAPTTPAPTTPAPTTPAPTTPAPTTPAPTTPAPTTPALVPPVLQVDAIWVTQLVPTGAYHRDAKGRRRPDKKRIKRPIFIALGVWPETGQAEVLAWRLAAKEDENDWLAFLSELEAMGVCGDNGLELISHDGGAGLCAALNTIYFGAAEQRCLFHKLRNIANAIRIDDDQLSNKEKRRRRTAILRDFRHIWDAKRLTTVLQRYQAVVRRYRNTQPAAVRCLRTDFRATIAYFTVLRQHPDWDRRFLRTTSWLERFNRYLRRRVRAAAAYHSDAGLCAMIAHEVKAFKHSQAKI